MHMSIHSLRVQLSAVKEMDYYNLEFKICTPIRSDYPRLARFGQPFPASLQTLPPPLFGFDLRRLAFRITSTGIA